MYPRSFLCEGAKIKRRTSLKEKLCKISEKAKCLIFKIWCHDKKINHFAFSLILQSFSFKEVRCWKLKSSNIINVCIWNRCLNIDGISCLYSCCVIPLLVFFLIRHLSTIFCKKNSKFHRKELCNISVEPIWESRFTCFFLRIFLPKTSTRHSLNYTLQDKNKCNYGSSKKGIDLSTWILTFWKKKHQKIHYWLCMKKKCSCFYFIKTIS